MIGSGPAATACLSHRQDLDGTYIVELSNSMQHMEL